MNLQDWIGRTETMRDLIAATPYAALYWLYFLPLARQSEIGPDGHPPRGGFLPLSIAIRNSPLMANEISPPPESGGGKWTGSCKVSWKVKWLATVGVPEVGAEEPVVGQERWEEFRRLKAAGMTVSAIARGTGFDRKTVRRVRG